MTSSDSDAEGAAPADAPVEYDVDALSAHTGVPTRTIRFYQSKGALQKPEKRGRKAIYNEAHVERLELIGQLQDRGLRIRAIRDLVARVDAGELNPSEWLGLQDSLAVPWTQAAPQLVAQSELEALTGPLAPGDRAAMARAGLVELRGDHALVPHPERLQTVRALEAQGVGLDVSAAALERTRKHAGRLATDLASLFEKSAGDGFGDGSAEGSRAAIEAWREAAPGLVAGVFAEEMQRALHEVLTSARATRLQG